MNLEICEKNGETLFELDEVTGECRNSAAGRKLWEAARKRRQATPPAEEREDAEDGEEQNGRNDRNE